MYISGQRLNAAFHEMAYSSRFPKSCARYITTQSYVLNKISSIDKFDQKKIQQKVSIQFLIQQNVWCRTFVYSNTAIKNIWIRWYVSSANLYKIWSLYNIVFVISSTCFQKKRSWFKVLKLNIVIWRDHLCASENANLYPPLCF